MAQEGKISLLGLANWNENLFGNMNWPDPFTGDSPVLDKQAFMYELFAQTAELEVTYPEPRTMQYMIAQWSKTRLPVWNLLWQTTQFEYNPIENYNRIEEGTDTDKHTGTTSETHSGSDSDTHSGTDSYDETRDKTGTDTNTTTPLAERYKAAYDSAAAGESDGLVKVERDEGETVNETEYGSTDTIGGSTTHGHVITTQHGEIITNGYADTMTKEHDLNVHGNIGTVTTQKMIQEQREIVTFNFYDVMIRDFIERFCILVY